MIRSWVEVSLPRLAENVRAIQGRLPSKTRIIAIVKANAYGHGMKPVAQRLYESGIRDFGVANLQEALELREILSDARILVLGGCLKGEEEAFRSGRLTAGVFDRHWVPPSDIPVEVKIDTGMTRVGIPWQEASDFIRSLKNQLEGVYSHFAASGSDPEFTRLQLERFLKVSEGLSCPRHICDSAGLPLGETHLDAVRIGLALYGVAPNAGLDYLRPVLAWKARMVSIHEVPAGASVGYGRTLVTDRASRIGVLPLGYADGYNRAWSNRGQVRVRGSLAPVVGRVSMDLTTVDLTDVPEAKVGDEVFLLEADASSLLSTHSLAEKLGTIPYEILTTIGPRITRVPLE